MKHVSDKDAIPRRTPLSPSTVLVAGFAATIIVGTILLMLPAMSTGGGLGIVDALFTATSAVCVTGLVVVDTGTYFSHAGQCIILLLIQIGGLGIFTFSTFFMVLLRGRTTLRGRLVIQETMTHFPYRNLFRLLRNIVIFTVCAEVLGAIPLWIVLREKYSAVTAVYYSLFHSVSAFCNAGFSLWSNSLEDYSGNVPVTLTIMTLIVLGGLGFTVVTEVGGHLFRKRTQFSRMSLNSRVVLTTTAGLIVAGALVFWFIERSNVLASRSPLEQALISVFQSVTARTAGFNTVSVAKLSSATVFILIILMFIGASPGSVGGGVKTTTFAIYVAMIVAYLRGRERVEMFGRTVPTQTASKAMATMATSFVLVVVAALLIQIMEGHHINSPTHTHFLDWLFEVVSAYGTVGLSAGETPGLSNASKLVIAGTMFAGRIGPLGLALSLFGREAVQRFKYPEEPVMIG